MKKSITISLFLIVLSFALPLFAATPITPSSDKTFAFMDTPFIPTSTRMLGMGNAGLAIVSGSDSLYYNPAGLASKKTVVLVGNPTVTVYHPVDFADSGVIDVLKDSDSASYSDLANSVIDILGSGYSRVLDVDSAVGFTAGGFGLMANAKASVISYNATSNGGLFTEMNAAAVVGYGHRLNIASNFSIDIGATAGFNYFGYTDEVTVAKVLNALDSDDAFSAIFDELPVMAGFRIPLNVGVNLNMPYNFKFAVVGRNLITSTKMNAYGSYNDISGNLFGGDNTTEFSYSSKYSIDVGLGWEFKSTFISPAVAVDFKDIVGFFQAEEKDFRSILYHTNIGAEIRLLSFLDIRGGLNQGYWTLGAGIDLWAIKIEAAYFVTELGTTAGDNPCDGLSIRFNIGWDR